MMYTIIPPELLFDPPQNGQAKTVTLSGRAVTGVTLPDGRFRVERLMSSRPADFLDPRFAPGAVG